MTVARLFTVRLGLVVGLVLLLGSCAVNPSPEPPGEERPGEPEAEQEQQAEETGQSEAVERLIRRANRLLEEQRPSEAEGTINRAMNLDSDHPVLWHQLARVRLQQDRFSAAETMAMRSLDFTTENQDLIRENWELISEAREQSGDVEGAREARERAGLD